MRRLPTLAVALAACAAIQSQSYGQYMYGANGWNVPQAPQPVMQQYNYGTYGYAPYQAWGARPQMAYGYVQPYAYPGYSYAPNYGWNTAQQAVPMQMTQPMYAASAAAVQQSVPAPAPVQISTDTTVSQETAPSPVITTPAPITAPAKPIKAALLMPNRKVAKITAVKDEKDDKDEDAPAPKEQAPKAACNADVTHVLEGASCADGHCAEPRCFGEHRCGVFGEYLYQKVRGLDVIFAQPFNGCGPLAVPSGPQGTLNPDFSSGFRAGFDVAFSKCSSIQASYTWWETTTHTRAVAPQGSVLESFIQLPQTIDCAADALSANGAFAVRERLGDIVLRHLICGDCCNYAVNWFAGARYGHLEQNLDVDLDALGATAVASRIVFDGAGPRLGLDGELACKWGFLVYGRGGASFLAGHFTADFSQNNTFVGNQGISRYKNDRLVPILDLELGVGWEGCNGHVRAGAGYNVSAWFNTVTTADFINSVQTNNFTTNGNNLRDCITFDGLVAHLEFRY